MASLRLIVLAALALPMCTLAATPAAPPSATTAGTPAAAADSVSAWRARTRAALVKRGDADGYLAALTILPLDASVRATYAEDAIHQSPHDADTLWMRWWLCATHEGCDRKSLLAPIRNLEPDNAAAWVPNVTAAMKGVDPFKVTAALQRVAQGTHFDDHAWSIGRRAGLAIIALPPPPGQTVDAFRTTRLLYSTANVGALGMPGGYRIVVACTSLMFFQARKPACEAIAKLLQASGSQQYEMIGLGLADAQAEPTALLHKGPAAWSADAGAGQLLPAPQAGDDPAAVALRKRYETLLWRMMAWNKLTLAASGNGALGKIIRDAIRTQPNQNAVIKTVLRARGIALTPPPAWKLGDAAGGK